MLSVRRAGSLSGIVRDMGACVYHLQTMSAARGDRAHHPNHGRDDREGRSVRALLPRIAAGPFGERQTVGQLSSTTNPRIGGIRDQMTMPNQRAGVEAGIAALF